MSIANLNAKVDVLHTYKLIQINSKTSFEGKPRSSEITSSSKQNECVSGCNSKSS